MDGTVTERATHGDSGRVGQIRAGDINELWLGVDVQLGHSGRLIKWVAGENGVKKREMQLRHLMGIDYSTLMAFKEKPLLCLLHYVQLLGSNTRMYKGIDNYGKFNHRLVFLCHRRSAKPFRTISDETQLILEEPLVSFYGLRLIRHFLREPGSPNNPFPF